ncbi:J domain-containing protein [Sanguibacter sp. Leaf3]|uniref:J domain-containing protein n=1 Tax=Sanguibacter sp. Leaf3 TaxID=1736209 RepID=UPI0006F98571|nr:J domain-containing protein [Sanguibacter sp. Leaf3]KQT98385.1 hypothetical protein ASG53_12045 [Sanguibacter sp. Leaf3]
MTTHYDTLGVSKDAADVEVISAAYRALSKKLHPDRPDGDADRFAEVNRAHDVLKNPDTRAEYDRTLAAPAAAEDDEPEPEETWGEETSYDEYADIKVEEPADEMDTTDAPSETLRPSPSAIGVLAVVAVAGVILTFVEGGGQWGWLTIFAAVSVVVWRTRASIPAIATAVAVVALAWCVRSSGAISVAADLTLWALPVAAAVAARLTRGSTA